METKIVTVQDAALGENILVEAGEILRKGGLVAFPTETVYGLGGDALNPESSKIFCKLTVSDKIVFFD